MTGWLAAMWLGAAVAGELRPVRAGDTLASIAAELGDPNLVGSLRALNGLGPAEEPIVGALLVLPRRALVTGADQQPFLLTARGDVRVDRAPATLHQAVPLGAAVCTGPDSYATLRVATHCTRDGAGHDDLTLDAGSCAQVIGAYGDTHGRSTVVRVLSGSIMVQDPPGDGHGHVTVQAGTGLTTGRDGGYRVTLEDRTLRAEALYAAVAIQGAGQEVQLAAGEGSRVAPDAPPTTPVALTPPGQPLLPEDGAVLRRPRFVWTPVSDAFGYRIEVAATPDFVDVVYQDDVPDPLYQPSLMMLPWPDDGELHWRIATFDRFGFLGVPSDGRRLRWPSAGGG